ncbi:hypothetical protein EZBTHKR_0682 [Elizabethkingia anophelis]|nr:hypothetical protein EZBTHKR_0682 [Elizabethkingia anophelis]
MNILVLGLSKIISSLFFFIFYVLNPVTKFWKFYKTHNINEFHDVI